MASRNGFATLLPTREEQRVTARASKVPGLLQDSLGLGQALKAHFQVIPKAPLSLALHASRAPARYYGAIVKPNTHGWIFCELVPGLDRHLPSSFSSSSFFFSFFFSTAAADDLSSGCLWIMSSLRDKEDNLLSRQHKEVLESSKHQRVHKSLRWDSETGGRSTEPLMTPAVMELRHEAPHGAYDTLWWARVIIDRARVSPPCVLYVLQHHAGTVPLGFACVKRIINTTQSRGAIFSIADS